MKSHASVYFWNHGEISPAVCVRGVDPNDLRELLAAAIGNIKREHKGVAPHPAISAAFLVWQARDRDLEVGIVNAPVRRSVGLTLHEVESEANFNGGLGLCVLDLKKNEARLTHGPVYEDLAPGQYNQWQVRSAPMPLSLVQPSTEKLMEQAKAEGKEARSARGRAPRVAEKAKKKAAKKKAKDDTALEDAVKEGMGAA